MAWIPLVHFMKLVLLNWLRLSRVEVVKDDDDDEDDGVVVDRWLLILASFDSFIGNADTIWYGCDLNADDDNDVVVFVAVAIAVEVEVVGIVDFDIDGW